MKRNFEDFVVVNFVVGRMGWGRNTNEGGRAEGDSESGGDYTYSRHTAAKELLWIKNAYAVLITGALGRGVMTMLCVRVVVLLLLDFFAWRGRSWLLIRKGKYCKEAKAPNRSDGYTGPACPSIASIDEGGNAVEDAACMRVPVLS